MDKEPLIRTGSMLNTGEGLLATSALAALVSVLNSATDWRAQAGIAISVAALVIGYAVVRGRTKSEAGK